MHEKANGYAVGSKAAWLAAVSALALALLMAGCSGSGGSDDPSQDSELSEPQQQEQQEPQEKAQPDFDGSAFSDTGEGDMYISTAGGTSEGGNVPEIAVSEDTVTQIGVNYFGGDGSVCTVYVDGVENKTFNAGDTQQTITIQGDAVSKGSHTVEVVAMDGDAPKIYKKAEYKVV